jgi:acetamidase/formamidase
VASELKLSRPLVVTRDEVLTLGEGETLEAAAQMALDGLTNLLIERTKVDLTEAAMLVSIAADVRISYIGGTPYQVRAAIGRQIVGF